jgi:hypothetical protein
MSNLHARHCQPGFYLIDFLVILFLLPFLIHANFAGSALKVHTCFLFWQLWTACVLCHSIWLPRNSRRRLCCLVHLCTSMLTVGMRFNSAGCTLISHSSHVFSRHLAHPITIDGRDWQFAGIARIMAISRYFKNVSGSFLLANCLPVHALLTTKILLFRIPRRRHMLTVS